MINLKKDNGKPPSPDYGRPHFIRLKKPIWDRIDAAVARENENSRYTVTKTDFLRELIIEGLDRHEARQDVTKDLDLTSEAVTHCPTCGAHTQGAKFCPECGKALRPKNECSKCGSKFEAGTKFCPECGNKVS